MVVTKGVTVIDAELLPVDHCSVPPPVQPVTVSPADAPAQTVAEFTVSVGEAGCVITVTEVAADVQPAAFRTVTAYVPELTAVKTPAVLV